MNKIFGFFLLALVHTGYSQNNKDLKLWYKTPSGNTWENALLAQQTIITKKSHGQMFQPVGNLLLQFTGHDDYTNYCRDLDIERAMATTTYTVNELKSITGGVLKTAAGENVNPFFQMEEIPAPVISEKAKLVLPSLKNNWQYDILTEPGKTYTFIAAG